MFGLDLHIIKTNILIKFQHAQVKNKASRVLQYFPSISPSDLVFDLKWKSFEFVQDMMEMNVLINCHEDPMQNVACRVLTSENVDDARQPYFRNFHCRDFLKRFLSYPLSS